MAHNEFHRKGEHEKIIEDAHGHVPDEGTIGGLSDFFKILSDPTRLKILYTMEKGEVCVCCISDVLGMSMSAVSHQLKTLRQAHLVKTRREGRNIYYSLDDSHVGALLKIALEHMGE
jgi:ArsR family transcriptional regulator